MEFITLQYLQPDTALQDRARSGRYTLLFPVWMTQNAISDDIETASNFVKYLQIWLFIIYIFFQNNVSFFV